MKRKLSRGAAARRRTRRRLPMMRRIRPSRPIMVNIMRTVYAENWPFSVASTSGFWRYYNVALSNLGNNAEYTALFDQYRINAVKVTFRPRFDGYDAGNVTTSGQNCPYLHLFHDPISTTAPTGAYTSATFNTFLENANGRVKSRMLNKPVSIYYKPQVADSGISGQTVYVKSPWLSTSTSTTNHRGFHAFISDPNFSANTNVSVDVFVTLYMQFKGSK